MDHDDKFLSPTATLLELGSKVQQEGTHCTWDGNCVPLDDSAIRLSHMTWLLSLVLPFTIVVEKSGSVLGMVVLIDAL